MTRIIALALALSAAPALAQEQQAGNAASTDAEGMFQALMDACDNIDAIMLRNRIRLQLPYTSEEAGAEAQEMINQGFATCGEGDVEGAKATLTAALDLATASATENLAKREAEQAAAAAAEKVEEAAADADEGKGFFGRIFGN